MDTQRLQGEIALVTGPDSGIGQATAIEVRAAGRRAAVLQLDQRDPAPVRDLSGEAWNDTIRPNLYGPFYCCREFIRRLDGGERHGASVNVASVRREIPNAGAAVCDGSRGGLMLFQGQGA